MNKAIPLSVPKVMEDHIYQITRDHMSLFSSDSLMNEFYFDYQKPN